MSYPYVGDQNMDPPNMDSCEPCEDNDECAGCDGEGCCDDCRYRKD